MGKSFSGFLWNPYGKYPGSYNGERIRLACPDRFGRSQSCTTGEYRLLPQNREPKPSALLGESICIERASQGLNKNFRGCCRFFFFTRDFKIQRLFQAACGTGCKQPGRLYFWTKWRMAGPKKSEDCHILDRQMFFNGSLRSCGKRIAKENKSARCKTGMGETT